MQSKIRRCHTPPGPSLLALSLALIGAVAPLSASDMPATYTADLPWYDQSKPTWVAAEVAFRADGSLDPALFHVSTADSLARNLDRPLKERATCVQYGEYRLSRTMPPDRSTFEKAVGNSELVLLARVGEMGYGFYFGVPGQLVRLEPVEYLKGQGKTRVAFHYFFYPAGTFDAGPYRICKTDEDLPASPIEAGDEVLLLIEELGDRQEPFLDLKSDETFLIVKPTGLVSVPKRFASDLAGKLGEPAGRGSLLSYVREILRRRS